MKKGKAKLKSSSRPPIVVVLGHVDHGKTTLLDYIRKTKVAQGEPGQITQHIGAYQMTVKPSSEKILRQAQDDFVGETHKITFIDTPGHEAFSKMRSRGANVADLAVLVVAADDGVMPQTQEAIKCIKQAKIPLIVAINKTDLPGVNLDKIKKRLAKEGVALEGYGGEVVAIPISAKTGQGVDDLLEMISLVSEMENLGGETKAPFAAVVIESKLDRNRGPVATVLVKNGTLREKEPVFAENIKGKVRAMINDRGERIDQAFPGDPIEILGLEEIPQVGAILQKEGAKIKEEKEIPALPDQTAPAQVNLKIILKTDVLGTLEAITQELAREKVKIISSGTGDISGGDILLAKTTGAVVIGFNVKITSSAAKLAETEHVKAKTYGIIYELLEEVVETVKALLAPPKEAEVLGEMKIMAEFPFEKGRIAGGKIIRGRLAVGDKIKVLREGKEIGSAKIKSLRQQKEVINKVEMGEECGILFEPLLDFVVGDVVISHR